MKVEALGGDPVIYVRDGCDGTERACNDDISGSDRNARVELALEAGTSAIFLDTYDDTTTNTTLRVTIAYAEERDASSDGDASAFEDAGASALDDAGMGEEPAPVSCACTVPGPAGPRLPGGLVIAGLVSSPRRSLAGAALGRSTASQSMTFTNERVSIRST